MISRIQALEESNKAEWGKMNIFQMLKHNTYWNRWILGKGEHTYRQEFMGKIFGKMALKQVTKDERLLDKNIPTSTQFKVKDKVGDLVAEKRKWIALLKGYERYSNPDFIHDFFGKMTKEQIGILAYKHTDHHLRQFSA